MSEQRDEAPKRIQAECAKCGGRRNCNIMASFANSGSYSDDHYDYSWHTDWRIVQCAGCDEVFVQTVSSNSEDYEQAYDYDGKTVTTYNETIRYWPALSKRKQPAWLDEELSVMSVDNGVIDRLVSSLKELYGALANDLHMLAGIGIRTSFDIASEVLGVDPGAYFSEKLEAIFKAGEIGKTQQEHIEKMVEAGHASTHRGWIPTGKDLTVLMDILEDFLVIAFVKPYEERHRSAEVQRLMKGVPERQVRKPKQKKSKASGVPNADTPAPPGA